MKKKQDKILPWNPDLKKDVKNYRVSYQPPKGERVKIKVSTPHKVGSPEFNQHVHFEAGKAGHKGGMISGCQEITKNAVGIGAPIMLSEAKEEKLMEKKKKAKPKRFIQPDPNSPLKRLGMLGAAMQLNRPKGSYKQFVESTENKKDVKKAEQKIEGGLADHSEAHEFNAEELRYGIEIEMEHTNDPDKAKEIAMDHLKEIPDYYTRLKAMEDKAEKDGIKKMDPEDMWEKKPSSKSANKPKMAEWERKLPKESSIKDRYKMGETVGFTDDAGKFREGKVTGHSGKLHVRDEEGGVHRIPEEKVHHPIKKIDCAHIELLHKSIIDDWLLRLGDEIRGIAKSSNIPFELIQLPHGAIRQYIFKVGNCAVVHKTLGRLVDVKCHSTFDSPQAHQKLAKALFYKLQVYYHKNPALSVEKHVGPTSMGVFKSELEKARALYGGQYSRPWQEGLAGQLNRRRAVTLRRKRRPQTGSHTPKSLQAYRESRVNARLMGQQEEKRNVGKSLTPFGKEFFQKTIKKLREKKLKRSAIAPSKPSVPKTTIDTPKAAGIKATGLK